MHAYLSSEKNINKINNLSRGPLVELMQMYRAVEDMEMF